MKLKRLILLVTITLGIQAYGQDNVARQYSELITEEGLNEYLSILASDALEGRETGKRGQKMAAAFIKAHFEEIGLSGPVSGDYYQPVILYTSIPGNIYVKTGETKHLNYEDIIYYGVSSSPGEVSGSVVFAGQGRKEDFDQVNVADKIVLLNIAKEENFRAPIDLARERKAKMVMVYNDNAEAFKELVSQFKTYMGGGVLSLKKPENKSQNPGVFFVSSGVAAKIMNTTQEKLTKATNAEAKKKALRKIKPGSVAYHTSMDVKMLKTDNVLGFLEGTDRKDEIIVITAHYDHIGKQSGTGDQINNGADDDGSGTVSVMEMAKAFAQAKKDGKGPRRSILFMTVTGEEKGLLGSDYYTQNPVFPLDKTIVNLNIDMVGRRDPQHKDSAPYVYVIGSDKLSSQLHALSESVNKSNLNLIFDYTYNDQNHPERLYYRSDHWNFAKNNIPVIFYFDGIHEDYHMPSDEVSKIEFDLLKERAQTVFLTAWEIANREDTIKPDEGAK